MLLEFGRLLYMYLHLYLPINAANKTTGGEFLWIHQYQRSKNECGGLVVDLFFLAVMHRLAKWKIQH